MICDPLCAWRQMMRDDDESKLALSDSGAIPRLVSLLGCSYKDVAAVAAMAIAEMACHSSLKLLCVAEGALAPLSARCAIDGCQANQEEAAFALWQLVKVRGAGQLWGLCEF